MGYGEQMIRELEQTIHAVDVDLVIVGTPINPQRCLRIDKPLKRTRYSLKGFGHPNLADPLKEWLGQKRVAQSEARGEDHTGSEVSPPVPR
jgi:predicted GTPase